MSTLVRIAPSPTGFLHVGNVRTALMNWLFTRQQGGKFMLRLDDTDMERSTQAFAEAIERDLKWLGLGWDMFAKQSERFERYKEVLEQFKAAGRAYPCFENQEELALKRKSQLSRGLPPIYNRDALKLTPEDIAAKIAAGQKPHWRFKLNDTPVVWDDLVQGHKSFPGGALSDPVLVREDGVPLYTFCSVVDDADMNVTHVVRGEDHVANTAVQIQIWEGLNDLYGGKPVPTFAHLPLITLASGEELSKRLGSMSVASLRDEMGVEPLAIASLLAKTGTSDAIEAASSMDDLIKTFDFKKIGRSPPKFDTKDLMRINAKIIHSMSYAQAKPRLDAMGLNAVDEAFWNAVHQNMAQFNEIKNWWQITHEKLAPVISDAEFIKQAAASLPAGPWDHTTWSTWTGALTAATGRKGKELFMPLRLALTAQEHGPEMKAMLPLIGEARTKARLAGQTA
ncbi:MAG: glutamate--tRNA ligase [Alphaproteobacteria bacterium]|nr:glutamate--tRNA ligase [Alphaproteobacteria bacterium]